MGVYRRVFLWFMCKHVCLFLHIYQDKHYYPSVPDNPNFCFFCKMYQMIKNYKWQKFRCILFFSNPDINVKPSILQTACCIFGSKQSAVLPCSSVLFSSPLLFLSPTSFLLPLSSRGCSRSSMRGNIKKGFHHFFTRTAVLVFIAALDFSFLIFLKKVPFVRFILSYCFSLISKLTLRLFFLKFSFYFSFYPKDIKFSNNYFSFFLPNLGKKRKSSKINFAKSIVVLLLMPKEDLRCYLIPLFLSSSIQPFTLPKIDSGFSFGELPLSRTVIICVCLRTCLNAFAKLFISRVFQLSKLLLTISCKNNVGWGGINIGLKAHFPDIWR